MSLELGPKTRAGSRMTEGICLFQDGKRGEGARSFNQLTPAPPGF